MLFFGNMNPSRSVSRRRHSSRERGRGRSRRHSSQKQVPNGAFRVELYSQKSLSDELRNAIITSNFCSRGASVGISPEWLEFQLSRAPIVFVGFRDEEEVCGFLIAFPFGKGYDAKDRRYFRTWTLDSICRSPDPTTKPITSLLMEALVDLAERNGAKSIELFASTDQTFEVYQKYGFRGVRRSDRYRGDNSSGGFMRLDLN